mmetsp:Transcript_25947/g.56878  ORF Transcript_25947/g.56878 Transcript_25947/m.56878 type:complete len:242 (+) Transcript_25947:524-1249(+)
MSEYSTGCPESVNSTRNAFAKPTKTTTYTPKRDLTSSTIPPTVTRRGPSARTSEAYCSARSAIEIWSTPPSCSTKPPPTSDEIRGSSISWAWSSRSRRSGRPGMPTRLKASSKFQNEEKCVRIPLRWISLVSRLRNRYQSTVMATDASTKPVESTLGSSKIAFADATRPRYCTHRRRYTDSPKVRHFRRRSDRTIGTESSCFASLAAMSCSSESEAPPREAKVSGRVRPSRGKTTPSNEYQ